MPNPTSHSSRLLLLRRLRSPTASPSPSPIADSLSCPSLNRERDPLPLARLLSASKCRTQHPISADCLSLSVSLAHSPAIDGDLSPCHSCRLKEEGKLFNHCNRRQWWPSMTAASLRTPTSPHSAPAFKICPTPLKISLPHQVLSGLSSRNMSTTVRSLWASKKADASNVGLKLLVSEGPHAQKTVGIWLFGCAAWVFSMVVLGGITRLTRSGLSMTDWKFTGSLPPLSEEQWHLEFDKYKESPEYKRVNRGMSLEDFKFIYWMEYAHRMWGRGLGLVFALPYSYFLWKGYITRQLGLRLSALFALGAGQGLIGWWMVKSGLEEPESEYAQPRVSPYRLASHLTSAFVIYAGLLWTAMSVVMPEPPSGSLNWVQGAAKVRKLAIPLGILVALTAVSGAFVAGNDAGHAYNTFPKMGDTWIPDDVFGMEPLICNFFENTSTVQLDHRILATMTLLSMGGLWWATRKLDIHPAVRSVIGSTMGMAALQVTLGISTLLSYVPVSLASAHQAGALTLMTLMILLTHTVRKPSPALLKSLASMPKSNC